jgi:hypothetical protein
MVDNASPIAYGYNDNLALWCDNGPIFNVSNTVGGGGGRRLGPDDGGNRPTGRGTADDPDVPQGRTPVEVEREERIDVWKAVPLTSEQLRNGVSVIPPAARPRVILRYADTRDLLVWPCGKRRRDRATRRGRRRAIRERPRRRVFQQSGVARRDAGQLFPGVQRAVEHDNLDAGRKLDASN